MDTIGDKIQAEIEKQAESTEQSDRIKKLFSEMPLIPLSSPGGPAAVNMHSLTIALCAAAFCVGKQPMEVPIGKIRTNAISIANNLFHEDGTFIE